jgi:hypothetical protein
VDARRQVGSRHPAVAVDVRLQHVGGVLGPVELHERADDHVAGDEVIATHVEHAHVAVSAEVGFVVVEARVATLNP